MMSESSNLTIEKRLEQLKKPKERPQQQQQKAKIQSVAHHLRDRKHFNKHYKPKLVSLGPIHYGEPKLKLGEHYKKMWAENYLHRHIQIRPKDLYKKMEEKIEYLKQLFEEDLFVKNKVLSKLDENEGFRTMEEKISWMLFVDGCALLHILEHAKLDHQHQLNVKIDQVVLVMQDVLLLENQLPFPLLKLLWRNNDERELMRIMKKFLECHHWATQTERNIIMETEFPPPTHLLHLQRSIILFQHPPRDPNVKSWTIVITNIMSFCLSKTTNENPKVEDMVTYRSIKELKEAGIGLKSTKTRRPRDVFFNYGRIRSELKLPEIVVDDTTAATMLNLIAYEMCPDFENDYGICSYVSFLDSLIDHADDVKILRKAKILLNSLGSDEEVANLFNTISTDLVPDMGKYAKVTHKIEKHYRNKRRTWLALGYHTYFSNPWSIIAFHAAVLGLVLTFIQTWYTVHPPS